MFFLLIIIPRIIIICQSSPPLFQERVFMESVSSQKQNCSPPCKGEALDCNPSGYHGHPKGDNLVLLFLRSKNNNKHACAKRMIKREYIAWFPSGKQSRAKPLIVPQGGTMVSMRIQKAHTAI